MKNMIYLIERWRLLLLMTLGGVLGAIAGFGFMEVLEYVFG